MRAAGTKFEKHQGSGVKRSGLWQVSRTHQLLAQRITPLSTKTLAVQSQHPVTRTNIQHSGIDLSPKTLINLAMYMLQVMPRLPTQWGLERRRTGPYFSDFSIL